MQLPDRGETAIRSVAVNADGSKAVAANNKGMCFVWQWSSELKDPGVQEEVSNSTVGVC